MEGSAFRPVFRGRSGGRPVPAENPGVPPAARRRAGRGEAAEAGGVRGRVQRGSRPGERRSGRQHAARSCGRSESSISAPCSFGRRAREMLLRS